MPNSSCRANFTRLDLDMTRNKAPINKKNLNKAAFFKGQLDMMPLNLAVLPWGYCVAHWRCRMVLVP